MTVFRGRSGRLELFAIDDGFLRHTWEETPGGLWSPWNTKGFPAPIRYDPDTEIGVTAHTDGRIETFGRASYVDDRRIAHCWANSHDSWGWSTVYHRGLVPIASSPSAANRRLSSGEDHLVVVATGPNGNVVLMQQDNPGDAAGWTDWDMVRPPMVANGRAGAALVAPAGRPLLLVAVDGEGRIHFTTDTSPTITPRWAAWTEIVSSISADGRPAVVTTPRRVWLAARGVNLDDVACWEIAAGRPVVEHYLTGIGALRVSAGAFPGEDAVYVVARARDGTLHGRCVEPTP